MISKTNRKNEVENSLSVHQTDIAYWERKFSKLSAIPTLPWKTPLQHLPTSRYQRNSLVIEKDQFKQLSKIGAKHSLFKNSVIMALILEVLSHWSTDKSLCVAVPTLPSMPDHFPIALRLLLLSGKLQINLLNKQTAYKLKF